MRNPSCTEAIYEALLAQPEGSAWLVATGALTNVALLFTAYPELAGHIEGLSIMGGAIGNGFSNAPMGHVRGQGERFGNTTRWAEFNIYVRHNYTLAPRGLDFRSTDIVSVILKQLNPSSRILHLPQRLH